MINAHVLVSTGTTPGRGHFSRQIALREKLAYFDVNLEIHTEKKSWLSQKNSIGSADFSLLDLSLGDQKFSCSLVSEETKIIAFDWVMDCLPDYNIVIHKNKCYSYGAKKNLYVGLEYFMVRSKIQTLLDSPLGEYALVSLGYGAPASVYLMALNSLRSFWSGDILVCGNIKDLKIEDAKVTILNMPSNFLEILAGSRLNCTNGGTTMVESLLLRKKTFVFPQTKMEYDFYNVVHDQFIENSTLLMEPFALNEKRKEFPSQQIDFDGTLRVATILTSLLK